MIIYVATGRAKQTSFRDLLTPRAGGRKCGKANTLTKFRFIAASEAAAIAGGSGGGNANSAATSNSASPPPPPPPQHTLLEAPLPSAALNKFHFDWGAAAAGP
jgi:hypothetical protein